MAWVPKQVHFPHPDNPSRVLCSWGNRKTSNTPKVTTLIERVTCGHCLKAHRLRDVKSQNLFQHTQKLENLKKAAQELGMTDTLQRLNQRTPSGYYPHLGGIVNRVNNQRLRMSNPTHVETQRKLREKLTSLLDCDYQDLGGYREVSRF